MSLPSLNPADATSVSQADDGDCLPRAPSSAQPTVTEGEPFDRYVDSPGTNFSTLKHILTSPLMYRHRLAEPREDTDALRAGRAVHCAVFEPDNFPLNFCVWRSVDEEGNKQIRRGKKWDAFRAANADKTPLTEEQYATALKIRDAVRRHPKAKEYLSEEGRAELSIHWTHKETGIRIKSRLDYLCSVLIDLKSTRRTNAKDFQADFVRMFYPMQFALYRDAAIESGLADWALQAKCIAPQTEAPHDVAVFHVGEDVLAYGERQYTRALRILADCANRDEWPGIAPGEIDLSLPMWARYDELETPDNTQNGEA